MKIKAPKRSSSFIALLIQTTAYISNQIAGAASFPDFFPILDWFYRKEMGEDYLNNLSDIEYSRIKEQFQNLIYSFNFPFRGGQSAFTNLSVMDKGFMKSLFDGYVLPDGTPVDIFSSIKLSKMFFEYFSSIQSKEGIFTFPVSTLAISLDDDGNYLDPDFVDWAAEANAPKAIANIFQSTPNAFSSCCRLKNEYKDAGEAGYQNSFGVGGLSIGSHRVAGINFPRLAFLEKENPLAFDQALHSIHQILKVHRKLMVEREASGNLPLYSHHWMDLSKQYSTVGFIGGYEYVRNLGMDATSEEGIQVLQEKLLYIEEKIKYWQQAGKEQKEIYNIEQIPGESMAVRLSDLDFVLGYNGTEEKRWPLYSNQYIPLIEDVSIFERMRLQGAFDSLTSGGSILHLNVDDEKPLSADQFKRLMVTAKLNKVVYFAVNYAYSESSKGVYSIGKHEVCPVNGDPIKQVYTRVVGFITPVKAWNSTRRKVEYPERVFYTNESLEDDFDVDALEQLR